jgi:hypothetical protein
MSVSFRPVREEWGEHSSMFVDREVLQLVLEYVAGKVKSSCSYEDYGEVRVIWIGKGRDFLNYVATSPKFTLSNVYRGIKDGALVGNDDELKSLISNMKNMTTSWLTSVDSSGGLRFYLD